MIDPEDYEPDEEISVPVDWDEDDERWSEEETSPEFLK